MNSHHCCEIVRSGSDTGPLTLPTIKSDQPSLFRRFSSIVKWLVPSAILALLPKCPACLAAYVAVGTGIGLSISTATYIRAGLIILCIGSLTAFGLAALLRKGTSARRRWSLR